MNFVEHMNLFGENVKDIPCIKGEGKPSVAETIAEVGCFYMDTLTGDTYKCTAVSAEGLYTWTPTTPLHFNGGVVNLSYIAYEDIFNWQDKGIPYSNSFFKGLFSRAPLEGELFPFVFKESKGRTVFGVAKITGELNDSGFYPFEMVFATLYYDVAGFTEFKNSVGELKTEEWDFFVEGSETPITKRVVLK